MPQLKTNEQLLRALLKDLDLIETMLLRERLHKISALTRQAITENPASFDNPIIHHSYFLSLCDKIDRHLGTQDKEAG